jgi:hypothetical protein
VWRKCLLSEQAASDGSFTPFVPGRKLAGKFQSANTLVTDF